MKNISLRSILLAILTAIITLFAVPLRAASLPNTVHLTIPFGPFTLFIRQANYFQQYMLDKHGVNVIINYKPGANGLIGHTEFSKAPTNGSAIILTLVAINIAVEHRMAQRIIEPLTLVGTPINTIVTYPGSGIETFPLFINEVRTSSSSSITMGWYTVGNHLVFNQIFTKLGVNDNTLKIAYKSSPEASTAVIGKHIKATILPLITAKPLIEAGRITLIAATGPRSYLLPENMVNITNFIPNWAPSDSFMFALPPGTSQDIIKLWLPVLNQFYDSHETAKFYHSIFIGREEFGPSRANELIKQVRLELTTQNLFDMN